MMLSLVEKCVSSFFGVSSVARPISLIVPLLTLVLASTGLAQSDPVGAVDSVVVSNVQVMAGNSFVMSVRLVNDEPLSAWSVPLHYDRERMTLDSVSFVNSISSHWSFLRSAHDAAGGSVLVGAVVLSESLIEPGGGTLFELFFHANTGREAGEVGLIDTAYIPPAGEFLLTAYPHANIYPAFGSGKMTIMGASQPPVFAPLSGRTVREGDELTVEVSASDPDGASLKLAAENLPTGAKFVDQGDGRGTLEFSPPHAGPGSASHGPYEVTFAASDGGQVSKMSVALEVINVNRAPEFKGTTSAAAGAGDTIQLAIIATDPDFEPITLHAGGLPAGAILTDDQPPQVIWYSAVADSGDHIFDITASDASGASSVQQYNVHLAYTIPAQLTISDEQAENGSRVEVELSLFNRVEIASFNLLIRYDRTAISLEETITAETRLANWDWMQVTEEGSEGLLWLNAECDTAGGNANALLPGDGAILKLAFWTSNDYNLAGFYSQVKFEFLDPDSLTENIIFQTDGTQIGSTQLEYNSGGVLVKAYDGLIGDLNLNDVAFEVADLVYFQNFFTDPFNYPLDGDRWPNSDVNQDGQPGTLADLTYMQQIIDGGGLKLAESDELQTANFALISESGGHSYRVDFGGEVAGLFCKFAVSPDAELELQPSAAIDGFVVSSGRDRDTLRVLILRPSGNFGGRSLLGELFSLRGGNEVELVSQELVDSRSRNVTLKYDSRSVTLPADFQLGQNYPNPFNPETLIDFALPRSAEVSLVVYNVLGAKVRLLIAEQLPAGLHQVRFDGRDDSGTELASGVYFYRLRAGTFENTRKMVLVK
jgi:hypothetical protein